MSHSAYYIYVESSEQKYTVEIYIIQTKLSEYTINKYICNRYYSKGIFNDSS